MFLNIFYLEVIILVDADPADTLDSYYEGVNEQKNTQSNVIEVEIKTLST